MELETEIPIWYKGKVKWISNLTTRSTCSDVIEAILASLSMDYRQCELHEDYVIYECWRGVERPLKNRCRLWKLWNSWAGECENVTLTLRSREEETIPTHILIRQQEKKLNRLKRQLNKTDKQIEHLNQSDQNNEMLIYFNLSRSIIRLNNEIKNEENCISRLSSDIHSETKTNINPDDFNQLLYDVNQTLIISRKLTLLYDQHDQQLTQINNEIDRKLLLLDELELDDALHDNIDLDSLDDLDDQQRSSPIVSIKTLTVPSRPTAIVEPSLLRLKSRESLGKNRLSRFSLDNLPKNDSNLSNKSSIHLIPISIPFSCQRKSINSEQSDTGISSAHSTDEHLITLV